MPSQPELKQELERLGIYEEGLQQDQQQLRLARFEGVSFGVAPPERWNELRRQLLEIEPQLAAKQDDVGLVEQQFELQLAKEPKFFHKPASLPPKQREWVKQEMCKLEAAGVVRRVTTCKVASKVVLVIDGQSGQDYRLCIDFTDLNAHTIPLHYPMQDARQFIDACAEFSLYTLADVKACFHNVAVAESSQPYLGIITQDGLFVCTRMAFGLHAAPGTCQAIMDQTLGSFAHTAAFIDDIVVRGHLEQWEELWNRSLQVLKALAAAGFMLNLRKTKFLEPSTDILGLHVAKEGYRLGDKCLNGWDGVSIPTSLLELQTILGKLVWASPFIPSYKRIVAPLEALLSRKSDGKWTMDHTAALNTLRQEIFARIKLEFPVSSQPFHLHPAYTSDLKTAVLTQPGEKKESTIAIIAARMTITEAKAAAIEKLLVTATWAVRALRRYILFAPTIIIFLPLPEHIAVIRDKHLHMRIRAYLLDLEMYNIEWRVGDHLMCPSGELLDYSQVVATSSSTEPPPPPIEHQETTINYGATTRRKLPELAGGPYWTVWFDGGASKGSGTGGFAIYDENGNLQVAKAVWFGDAKPTVNQAEMGALLAALNWMQHAAAPSQVMVCGDSKLTIDFFNRSARPANTALFLGLKEGQALLKGRKAAFRHHPRDLNQLADWLTRVARVQKATIDLTTVCTTCRPHETPPLPPTSNRSELLAGVGRGAAGKGTGGGKLGPKRQPAIAIRGGVAKRKAIKAHKLAPAEISKCQVCSYRDATLSQCWGCGEHFHPLCLGVRQLEVGPFYCPLCRKNYEGQGVRDITLQLEVMFRVVQGKLPDDLGEDQARRVERAAKYYRWSEEKLWMATTGTHWRKVPPLRDRRRIVRESAASLGYPGGGRLYHLLVATYYWPNMRQDVGRWCSEHYPNYTERLRWKPPPYLQPHHKSHQPFHTWAVDLVTRLTPPTSNGETTLIVGVDVFTKFVEASPLSSKSSLSTAQWLYSSIFCRYGVPALIRCDMGTEFKGEFQALCRQFGVKLAPVCRANPRANGQVERYNGAIRAGFRRMTAAAGTPWFEALPTILASLRFLPTYVGYSPFLLTYKQSPQWVGDPDQHSTSIHTPEHSPLAMEKLIDEMAVWWDAALEVVRGRLDATDATMMKRYQARQDLEELGIWVDLAPGDKVVIRTALPGKMQPRLDGPGTFLRHVGANGLAGEVMMGDGSIRREALANLRLYQVGITAEPIREEMVVWGPTLAQDERPLGGGESDLDDYLSSGSDAG